MIFFIWIASIAIILGAVLSAFRAKQPSRFVMWLVAYLTLIVGVVQIGLLYGWYLLNLDFGTLEWLAFIIYNVGNVGVILGRAFKGKKSSARTLVNSGGVLLGVAMLILLRQSFVADFSSGHVVFVASILVILIGMPTGLVLSSRSHRGIKQ